MVGSVVIGRFVTRDLVLRMAQMIGKFPFHAVKTDCARYDCGDKVGFLHANLAVGLSRPDIAPQLNADGQGISLGLGGRF